MVGAGASFLVVQAGGILARGRCGGALLFTPRRLVTTTMPGGVKQKLHSCPLGLCSPPCSAISVHGASLLIEKGSPSFTCQQRPLARSMARRNSACKSNRVCDQIIAAGRQGIISLPAGGREVPLAARLG